MRVAIHQPHYMPWLGYLRKMKEVDVFVYLDKADYTKNSFINRNRIQIDGKEHWLTVPVLTKGRSGQMIKDVEVNWDADWTKKHYHALLYNYGRKTEALENGLSIFYFWKQYHKLIEWCVESVRLLQVAFKVNPKIVFESLLGVQGSGTDRLVNICRALGADTYLSGPSGRDYLDESRFGDIKVEYMDWKPRACFSALHYYLINETKALEA